MPKKEIQHKIDLLDESIKNLLKFSPDIKNLKVLRDRRKALKSQIRVINYKERKKVKRNALK